MELVVYVRGFFSVEDVTRRTVLFVLKISSLHERNCISTIIIWPFVVLSFLHSELDRFIMYIC